MLLPGGLPALASIACFITFLGSSGAAHAEPENGDPKTPVTDSYGSVISTPQSGVAETTGADPTERPRRDPSLFTGGLVLAISGGVTSMVGAALITTGMTDDICFGTKSGCNGDAHGGLRTAGVGALVAGAVMIGIGIPLAVVGGKRSDPRQVPPPRAMLTPLLGPGQAGSALTVTF
jgi:hypothetical protein